ncbi:LytTR family DNA-binding domain-containing protein [Caulobacter sp. UNC358MFTsu5.1]|uniref:LytTR family DNA-binding domain-containing protein n=1 Tax=Caulobacter sp. UNC358MFTsu5.1 TaxID=1449049 RepID=UPI000AB89324|nr:LytTR family transcriptional regulator DNA-binding domain-containing protein [Caulobacter sp. UNC358MFTsu5.1]
MTIPFGASPIGRRAFRREHLREAIVMLVCAAIVVAMGPFGAVPYRDWPARTLYWLRIMALGYAIVRPCLALASAVAKRWNLPEGLAWAAASVVAAAPVTALVWWLGPHPDLSRPPPSLADFLDAYVQVLVVTAFVVLALWLARAGQDRTRGRASGQSATPTAEVKPALARRLPPGHGAILALSMEDHYVRVHAQGGQTLLLMRMADAVAAVEGLDGAQVHRSWWVARSAVERCERRGRRFWLLLPGGLPAPVARDRVKALIARGWPLERS